MHVLGLWEETRVPGGNLHKRENMQTPPSKRPLSGNCSPKQGLKRLQEHQLFIIGWSDDVIWGSSGKAC
ncbi:hypothetical protein EXN66_Car014349 [Channa argus]|uniref:Uncharacterized protein n=1 Tax=Channa argus TaxID=215402 RepID=A0A6G1Q815_CHAAH|nr:hypothetical protein EXN66_Car014349 [Channa argus]